MTKQFYNAQELAQLLRVGVSTAYRLIKKMNDELERKGYITLAGKVPIAYVQERFFGVKD